MLTYVVNGIMMRLSTNDERQKTIMKTFKLGKKTQTDSEYIDAYWPVLQLIGNEWVEVAAYETKEFAKSYVQYWNEQREQMVEA